MRAYSNWQWHLDEVFVKINGEVRYVWRAVDHEGKVLESRVTKCRDRKAALKFPRKTMKRYGCPRIIMTDKLRSYGAALKIVGNADRQETGRWLNNRAENPHPPFRRRERAMVALSAHSKFAEIRHRPCLRPQSFQPGTSLPRPNHSQVESRPRSRRVAPTWRGIRESSTVFAEIGLHWSDSTEIWQFPGRVAPLGIVNPGPSDVVMRQYAAQWYEA